MGGEVIHRQGYEQEQARARPRGHQHIPIPECMQLRPPNDGEQRGGSPRWMNRARH